MTVVDISINIAASMATGASGRHQTGAFYTHAYGGANTLEVFKKN